MAAAANPLTTPTHTVMVAVVTTEAAVAVVTMTLKVRITRTTTREWETDVVEGETSVAEEEVTGPPIVEEVAQTVVVQEIPVIPMMVMAMMTPNHQRPVPTAPL